MFKDEEGLKLKDKAFDYGEILFLGKCNFKCYYCIGREMYSLQKDADNNMRTHFLEWKNFPQWVSSLIENNISLVYLSSTVTEPLMYKYLDELVDYLQTRGISVGVRTNASFITEKVVPTLLKMQGEVSISIQSLIPETFTKISGVPLRFDLLETLKLLKDCKNLRCTVVVNQHNYLEIPDLLAKLGDVEGLKYVQVRKYYLHGSKLPRDEEDAFTYAEDFVTSLKRVGNYHESPIYETDKGLGVSLWRTVFKRSSLKTTNYWTNGLITGNNLLVPGYEESKKGFRRYGY